MRQELAVILVEQHARLALSLAENAVVLERGKVAHGCPSADLLQDPELLQRLIAVA